MTREESEKRYEEFAKENKRWNEKIDKAIDAMAEGAKSDERRWSIRHQEHVGAQVAGPPTEWVEVVPAARLADVEAERDKKAAAAAEAAGQASYWNTKHNEVADRLAEARGGVSSARGCCRRATCPGGRYSMRPMGLLFIRLARIAVSTWEAMHEVSLRVRLNNPKR